MYSFEEIQKTDSEVAEAIRHEMERQNSHIELIASENWVSKAVMVTEDIALEISLALLSY